jgi:hypothetical protein
MALSGVLASHRGGPGSISGRDMSVLGPLVRMEMTLVKSLHNWIGGYVNFLLLKIYLMRQSL